MKKITLSQISKEFIFPDCYYDFTYRLQYLWSGVLAVRLFNP